MSIQPITIQGKQFMCGTSRFMVRGIALSANAVLNTKLQNIEDILSDEHAEFMANDVIPKLVSLNVNCVRVYQVDPNRSHGKTMKLLEKNNIYVMVGLATSYNSVNQMTGEYTQATFVHAARVVDEFQNYNNTFCFSVGNEVEFPGQMASNIKSANPALSDAEVVTATVTLQYTVAQSMKSFARDIKNHIKGNNYRQIPVGVAMQDGPESSWGTGNPNAYQQGIIGTDIIAQFYTSGNADKIMDFIGINSYRYVSGSGQASVAYSGLANNEAPKYPVPAFLTESGGLPQPNAARSWNDVPTLYPGTETYYKQLSGQIAFQLIDEGAGYGIYTVNNDNSLSPQFTDGDTNLATQFSNVSAISVPDAETTPMVPVTAPSSTTPPGMSSISLSWPDLLPLKTYLVPDSTVTVSNYSSNSVLIIQQGGVIGKVGAASSQGPPIVPTSANIHVVSGHTISVLGNSGTESSPTWIALCDVPAASVTDGMTFTTAVDWGSGVACPISTTVVSVTVENYSTSSSIVVVQNGHVMGSVAAATSDQTPASATVSVTPGVDLLIQGPAPSYNMCCKVSAADVTAGITISNNITWGSGAVCMIG
ncbi:MAG: hypothetical protein IM638_08730 [Bacteroidetes bacterium]|nr:hypothetical protein [Bacteroidota bacterium]